MLALLGLLPCGVVVFSFAALLANVDMRTGRGYALGAVSSLHLAFTIIIAGTVAILAQAQPHPISHQNGSVTIWLVFYFVPSVYAILVAVIGATIVAWIAHHWLWILGFVVAAAVPFLVAALPYSLWDPHTDYIVRQVGFLGVLVLPEAAVLAYSITRLAHPVAPARQLAPHN
ncbi:MAG TPA: hypothetical protein VFQ25_08780 [Ktedonobacterales bacterium]|nr:hypothetical protein [Ktedonobacterales bacterium]